MILLQGAGFDPQLVKLMPRRSRPRTLARIGGSLFGIFLLGLMVCIIAAVTGLEVFWLAMATASQQ